MKASDLSSSEFNAYYGAYINLAENQSLIDGLQNGLEKTVAFFESIPADKQDFAYAEGKWTIKEILRHIIDTERIFTYRALRFARNDTTALPGYEQDDYILPAKANELSMQSLLEEYKSNRLATIAMFSNFTDEMLKIIGEASNYPMSARASGFITIGHEIHHCKVINERYL